jgi:hypothetical protein
MTLHQLNIKKHSPISYFKKFLDWMGVNMPHFNKGIYKGVVEYIAKPVGKFRTPLSMLGIYLPYAPGDRVNFTFSTKALKDGNVGPINIFCYRNDKLIENVASMGYTSKKQTIPITGWSISSIDHFIYQIGKNGEKDVVVIVDAEATSNDKWMLLIIGAIFGAIFAGIVSIILSFF